MLQDGLSSSSSGSCLLARPGPPGCGKVPFLQTRELELGHAATLGLFCVVLDRVFDSFSSLPWLFLPCEIPASMLTEGTKALGLIGEQN